MAGGEGIGWVKSHRRMEFSPVWRHHNASRLLHWMIWCASPEPAVARTPDGCLSLARGQFYANYDEIARRCHLSVDQVKRACALLRTLEVIDWQRLRRGVLITVVNYRQYQDRRALGEEGEEIYSDEKQARTANRTGTRTAERAIRAPQKNDVTTMPEKKSVERDNGGRTSETTDTAPQTAPQTADRIGSSYIKKFKKLKKLLPPNPPFAKGGRVAAKENNTPPDSAALLGSDADRYQLVLSLWQEERASAGLEYLEDRSTAAGADALAREYLTSARLSTEQLRLGMRKLCAGIRDNPRWVAYDLRTLAKNPSKFCPPPPIAKASRKYVRWGFVCDVCGATACMPPQPASAPQPSRQPCVNAVNGCQGTMRVFVDEEFTK